MSQEGPEGVKWELGLEGFALGKWDSSPWDWDLDTGNEKNVKNQKWEWDLRIAKYPFPFQDPQLSTTLSV